MSEIAVRNDDAAAVAPVAQAPALVTGSAIETWAYEARMAAQIATSLAKTSFVPQSMRGKADDITAAILAGQELGLSPLASLRSMDIIQGTPGLRAHAMRALVQAQGHDVELVESSETRCVMRGRRKGSSAWQTITWTIERAARLGLTGKDQWRKQPATMLIARATGEVCRLVAADALHAMPYAIEELGGGHVPGMSDAAEVEAVEAQRPVTVAELTGPDPADVEPEPVDPPEADEDLAEYRTVETVEPSWPDTAEPGSGSHKKGAQQ